MTTYTKPLIAITMGDPAGIGPEIILKALNHKEIYHICRPLVIGSIPIFRKTADDVSSPLKIARVASPDQARYDHGLVNILAVDHHREVVVSPGKPDKTGGNLMIQSIETAISLCMQNKASAMVTAPVNKTVMKLAGCEFHGHTELIAERTGTRQFAMMMTGPTLKVVLVTIHVPLQKVPGLLNHARISDTIRLTANALKTQFGIPTPSIAVAGLNPHAGEAGMFGHEEADIIAPAIAAVTDDFFSVTGPLPPDTAFYQAAAGKYHAVIAMYHDQGLIPFKMIHFKDGVNTTIGLPIIRTSVDHGTAYDIAGRGIADELSLISAIQSAADQARFRNNASDITINPGK